MQTARSRTSRMRRARAEATRFSVHNIAAIRYAQPRNDRRSVNLILPRGIPDNLKLKIKKTVPY